jgi:hypothetical protein
MLDRLAHRRRHREHARIAARNHRHPISGGRGHQGSRSARDLLAIVGRFAALAGPFGHPCQIGRITQQQLGIRQRRRCFGRDLPGVSGAEPDHGQAARHGCPAQPGTRMIEK